MPETGGMTKTRRLLLNGLLLLPVLLLLLLLSAPPNPCSNKNAGTQKTGWGTYSFGGDGLLGAAAGSLSLPASAAAVAAVVAAVVAAAAFVLSKDYYQLLGVRRNASQRAIDKAYRKLAKRLHPDVAPGKEREFMEIAKAHEVLSDPEQRRKYDAFGEEGIEGIAGMGAGGADGFPFDVFA
ncbi:hypothetical protein Emed_003566 [Eimeria media]